MPAVLSMHPYHGWPPTPWQNFYLLKINSWSRKKDIKTGGYGILNNWCISGASD
jgi:hypothetical protein